MYIIIGIKEVIGDNTYDQKVAVKVSDDDLDTAYDHAIKGAMTAYTKRIIGRKMTKAEQELWKSAEFRIIDNSDALPKYESPIKIIDLILT